MPGRQWRPPEGLAWQGPVYELDPWAQALADEVALLKQQIWADDRVMYLFEHPWRVDPGLAWDSKRFFSQEAPRPITLEDMQEAYRQIPR